MSPIRLSLVALLAVAACGDDTAPTAEQFPAVAAATTLDLGHPADYTRTTWPPYYTAEVLGLSNVPVEDPITDRGATLGRVLFHDRHLSLNDTRSCASCHIQGSGFSDPARFSLGFGGTERTQAHSMRLGNARFYWAREMFWDRRAGSLEAQATEPIRHAVEMGFDDEHGGIDSLIAKMHALPYYPELFAWVYGDSTVTEDRIRRALAQYVRSIVATDSKFDRAFARAYNAAAPGGGLLADFPGLTAQENRGKSLFLRDVNQGGAGCASCHLPPTFALAPNSRSNGLDAGEFRVFKAPSLKDVGVTGPYMHDGRFTSLGQVVGHYMRNVQDGPALDDRLRGPGGRPQRLTFEPSDENAIVAFLLTLTDQSLPTDPRFTDPFRP